ncbi:MAG: GAF domain-containing protein, partial [Myxococcales bacterium]
MSPREPADEPQRLATLDECQILDTPREESFDEIAQLAADLCGAPMAAVSFLDADRQWFKARVGLPMESTPRQDAFCDHALTGSEALVVDDVFGDPRFAANPLVLDDPHVRFYAGVPLRLGEGSALGTLCVLDRQPRTLTARQLAGLHREPLGGDLAARLGQVAPQPQLAHDVPGQHLQP